MIATSKPLTALTAGDLMIRDVVQLPEDLPLREAAQLLLRNQIAGAPVVDTSGRCIGVWSAIDFLRLAEKRPEVSRPASPPQPITCSFQRSHRRPDGREEVLCTLPPGVCPLQMREAGPPGEHRIVCSQPHCVLMDWQVVDLEKLPTDAVRQYMTPDPVTVGPDTSLRTVAQMMVDAHIHRIIVVDDEQRPVGVVSTMDLLTAVARHEPD